MGLELNLAQRGDRARGFSLIELMIVVAIMLLIAAIAIPSLLRARIAANESSAAAAIRTITSAEIAYSSAYATVGYAVQIQDLGGAAPCTSGPTHACVLDDNLAQAVPGTRGHSGYQFLATGINSGGLTNSAFVTGTAPLSPQKTGDRNFCAVTDGTLRIQPSVGGLPVSTLAACLAYPVAR